MKTAKQKARFVRARRISDLIKMKDTAYAERNMLVAWLSKIYSASLERHPEKDKNWEDDWRWIVFIQTPNGQVSWHIHDSELTLFDHLPRNLGVQWDGHSTEEKYLRIGRINASNLHLGIEGKITDRGYVFNQPFVRVTVPESAWDALLLGRQVNIYPES